MAAMVQCPKCGFEQDEGAECLCCGIIFNRIHQPADAQASGKILTPDEDSKRPATGLFRRYYRIFRWVSLFVFVIAVGLILYDSPPPEVETTPQAAKQAEVKLRQFKSSIQHGQKGELELNQPELNGWLKASLAMPDPVDSDSSRFLQREPGMDSVDAVLQQYEIDEEELEKAKSSMHDLQVELLEDTLRLYALFEAYGIDLSLEIEGRLLVRNGCLRLEPIRGRLGSLPLPSATLQKAVDRLFESPENREQFRLPPTIRDIKIDNGRLIVSS
jgi:hypothetical protein